MNKYMVKKLEQVHDLKARSHSVYTIHYHIIQCVKYRRRVFCFEEINKILKEKVLQVCNSWKINLIAFGVDKNHFHILIETPASLNLSKFMNNLKSSTSRFLRNRYAFLKRAIPFHLWSPSYCLISCGNVSLPIIKNYVEKQGQPRLKRYLPGTGNHGNYIRLPLRSSELIERRGSYG